MLVVSFVALATLWPRPRLERVTERRVWRAPAALEVLCGALGRRRLRGLVYAGFAGTQSATANLVPTVVYVVFWVGMPFTTLLLGDVFARLQPVAGDRAGHGWAYGRLRGGREAPAPLAYPRGWGAGRPRRGSWPSPGSSWSTPTATTRSQLAIMAARLRRHPAVGMSLYGIEPWSRNADAFGVYFGLFARLSPLHWRERSCTCARRSAARRGSMPAPGTSRCCAR